jgi:low temperature requirement protein LtrA
VSAQAQATPPLRDRSGNQRVTNIELFFDLVYVFAVTQLSHHLLGETTIDGAFQTAILLAMVWLAWAYTTWVTNWLDPDRLQVRLLLVVLMLISLAMSAALPRAFGDLGIWVGGAYALMQIGRTAFMVAVLPDGSLRRNYERIQVWCLVSGALAVGGGLVGGHARELLWLLAVGVDGLGGIVGFATPGLGRSRTSDWTIVGGHFAERCQAFILIALGESIVIIGASLSGMKHLTATSIAAFVVAFAGSVALWWLYFDRSAQASAEVIERSDDPGRLGRTAYHLIHPVMVAGIIVAAAGDQDILTSPSAHATASAWLILGGPALFLAGHAAFKYVLWGIFPWTRLAGIAVLALLGTAAPVLPEIALAGCAAAVVAVVAAADRRPHRSEPTASAPPASAPALAGLVLVGLVDHADAVVGEQER